MSTNIGHAKGFTLIEILLSVVMIVFFTVMTFGVFHTMEKKSEVKTTADTFVHMSRRAQLLSRSGVADEDWSVKVTDTQITLYQGDDYATRDTLYDEVYDIPDDVVVFTEGVHGPYTVVRDYTYEPPRGLPSGEGSMIFESDNGDVTFNITINDQGAILY